MDNTPLMKLFGTDVSYTLTENARKMLREAAEKETWRVETMYKSPVEIIYQEMQTQIDGDILRAVQSYNINVDRNELIKALNYDRDQYQKGFKDGKKAGPDWIPVSERLPEDRKDIYWVCTEGGFQCQCRWTDVNPFWTNLKTDWHWCHFDTPQYQNVIAWMPLPAPYTPDHQEESNE